MMIKLKGIKESIKFYENIKNNTNDFSAVLKDAYNLKKSCS